MHFQRKTMLTICCLALTMVMTNCKKDMSSSDNGGKPKLPAGQPVARVNFAFVSASNGHSLSNLQTDDELVYSYSITCEGIDSIKAFEIAPFKNTAINHQEINRDYSLYYDDKQVNSIMTNQKKGHFKIKILKPGSFNHTYIAKVITNNRVIETKPEDIFFNAVRIVAYVYYWTHDRGTWFTDSKNKAFDMIWIDMGSETNDKYLAGLPFKVRFSNKDKEIGIFNHNRQSIIYNDVYDYRNWDNHPEMTTFINELAFTKDFNGVKTSIKYENIRTINKGYQNGWQDKGFNNW